MPLFNVLMTTTDYVEVEADNPSDAKLKVMLMYQEGDIATEDAEFFCEECDEVKL
jgi:hypothetical protein